MPINIVYEYDGYGFLRRFFSKLMRFIGAFLIFVGLIALMWPLLYLIALVASILTGKPFEFDSDDLPSLAISTLIMIVSMVLGRWLLRGRRQPVLFLRRFGFVGATEALTFALATAIGHSWRLVTLDDQRVAAVGAGRKVRWASAIAGLIGFSILAYTLYWVFGSGLDDKMTEAMNDSTRQNKSLAGALGGMVASLIVGLVVFVIMIVVGVFFAVLAMFSLGGYLSVRRAERSKKLEVSSLATIDNMVTVVARRSRRVLSPKLIVVRVATPVWQETVHRLALICSAIVIDISEPTPNLLWEIEKLKAALSLRWILVAEHDRLMKLNAAGGESINSQLLAKLDGEDVLAYSIDRSGKKRFARALRARLEQLSSLPQG